MLNLTLEQMYQISGMATISMHDDFDAHGEPDLKKMFPVISTSMVEHVLRACDKLMNDIGNESNRKAYLVTEHEGDKGCIMTSLELAEQIFPKKEDYFIMQFDLYGGLV